MEEIEITIKLPKHLCDWADAADTGHNEGLSERLSIRLANDLRASIYESKRHDAKRAQSLSPLRALLSVDFAQAKSWQELQGRLMVKGYVLKTAGGGIAIHHHPKGPQICSASKLGQSYTVLMQRFGMPFPGHAHRTLVNRLLGHRNGAQPARTSTQAEN